MKITTPVAFIMFNRPDTSVQVFEAIRKAKPQKLYLISDAAREGKPGEAEKVRECHESIEKMIDWDCEVHKNYAEKNMGCKMRVSSGISWVLEHEEETIILEDDVIPSEQFFPYMQQMLTEYRDEPKVMIVSGTNLLRDYEIKEDYIFSNFPSIWGWGTWRRAWSRYYDVTMGDWPEKKNGEMLKKIYPNRLSRWLYKRNAEKVYQGLIDTWDTQWNYCRYKQGGLGIVPKVNMVNNIGFDREDATHTKGESFEDFSYGKMNIPCSILRTVEVDPSYEKAYLKKAMGMRKILNAVKKKLKI